MKKLRMWWAIVAVFLVMTAIAARSVLAVPMPDPKLGISLKDLPAVSSHPVPVGWPVRSVFFDRARPSQILVSRGEDGVWRAFSNRSTHRWDPVTWSEEHQRFIDFRFGSVWDRNGRNVAGPAPRGLDWYPVTVEGDLLVVDLARPQFGR